MVLDPIRHREEQRRYRAKNLEKIRAKQRDPAFREKMRIRERGPASREKRQKWRDKNADKVVEYNRRHREKTKEARAIYKKAWRLANHDRHAAYTHAYYVENRVRILQQQAGHRLTAKSINAIRHDPDTVYRVVSRAVSAALPRFMRDDVINSILLAVLEGELLLENIGARMKDYLGRYNREYDCFKTLSLDAPMGGTDLRRINLLEAPAPYEPEEDEEDPDMMMLRGGYSRW